MKKVYLVFLRTYRHSNDEYDLEPYTSFVEGYELACDSKADAEKFVYNDISKYGIAKKDVKTEEVPGVYTEYFYNIPFELDRFSHVIREETVWSFSEDKDTTLTKILKTFRLTKA